MVIDKSFLTLFESDSLVPQIAKWFQTSINHYACNDNQSRLLQASNFIPVTLLPARPIKTCTFATHRWCLYNHWKRLSLMKSFKPEPQHSQCHTNPSSCSSWPTETHTCNHDADAEPSYGVELRHKPRERATDWLVSLHLRNQVLLILRCLTMLFK